MARNMVSKWGLSDALGPILYDDEEAGPFGGGYGQGAKPMAQSTLQQIDQEVRKIIDESYQRAYKVLEDNRDILESMTQALMKYETVSSEQIDQLMAREPVSDPDGWNIETPAATASDDKVVPINAKADQDQQDIADDLDLSANTDSDENIAGNSEGKDIDPDDKPDSDQPDPDDAPKSSS